MPRKTNTMTEAERSASFIEKARELECDDSAEAFDKRFAKIVPPKKSVAAPKKEGGKAGRCP